MIKTSSKAQSWVQAVETELKRIAKNPTRGSKPSYHDPQKYIVGQGNSQQKFLHLKMPVVREVLKNQKLFSNQENLFEKVQTLWFTSQFHEAKTLSLLWLDQQSEDFLLKHQKNIIKWISVIDNWAHSDGLSSLLTRIYELDSSHLHKVFVKWNTHKSSWHRRQSMVSLFYYSSARKKQPAYKIAEKFVRSNITYPEYYVQKGVGWTLREMHNVYPEQTFNFLQNNIKSISSIAWVAATEKLSPSKKRELIKKRKT